MLQSIEKREDVLREALEQNEQEVERWKSFVEENETAINNMNTFSKKLTVDVMVPFGNKAFFPGRIIHTNEVLVAHYQNYFSECSTHVAIEICKQRIETGKERLAKLEDEKVLFQNKLEKPYLDGVLPKVEEREIIEEYDEEKEKIWREQHRQRVKESKLKEKKDREELMSKYDEREIFETLEENEKSINELNEELIELETEHTNETKELLSKLISGEISLPPPKKRIAHGNVVKSDPLITKINNQSKVTAKVVSETYENKTELVDDEDDDSTSDVPEEIRLIEEQASFLPQNDRFGFYQYQLQIIDQKIAERTFSNSKELEQKLHLFKIRDYLEELLEEASPAELDSETNDKSEEVVNNNSINTPKRRISFATEDQLLEFKKNETVAQMLPNIPQTQIIPERDVIRLDEPSNNQNETDEITEENVVNKKKTILEKVEENLKNNNLEDADLVSKIIDSTTNHIQTLHIHFKHSPSPGLSLDSINSDVPTTPADFPNLFCQIERNDLAINTDNNFYLKESDRDRAYVDVRAEFLTPHKNQNEDVKSKSILKNKNAVHEETHIVEKEEKEKNQSKKPKNPNSEECFSAYNAAVGDVIENASKPDVLPQEKFVDMHAPKKRISRFKQMRKEKI